MIRIVRLRHQVRIGQTFELGLRIDVRVRVIR